MEVIKSNHHNTSILDTDAPNNMLFWRFLAHFLRMWPQSERDRNSHIFHYVHSEMMGIHSGDQEFVLESSEQSKGNLIKLFQDVFIQKQLDQKHKLFIVQLLLDLCEQNELLSDSIVSDDARNFENCLDWILEICATVASKQDKDKCILLGSLVFRSLSAKQYAWMTNYFNERLLEIQAEEKSIDENIVELKHGIEYNNENEERYAERRKTREHIKTQPENQGDLTSVGEGGLAKCQRCAGQVTSGLELLMQLEKGKAQQNYTSSVLFSEENSSLMVSSLKKGSAADFDMIFSFKLVSLVKSTSIPLLTIEDANSPNILLWMALEIADNNKVFLNIIVMKKNNQRDSKKEELGNVEELFAYSSIHLSLVSKDLVKISLQRNDNTTSFGLEWKGSDYLIRSAEEVNVIIGSPNNLPLKKQQSGNNSSTISGGGGGGVARKSRAISSTVSAWKLNWLEFRKETKNQDILSHRTAESTFLINATLAQKSKILRLRIDSSGSRFVKCMDSSSDQHVFSSEPSDIFDSFDCIESDKRKSDSLFSKLNPFKSDSSSGSSKSSSWSATNQTKVHYFDVRLVPHVLPQQGFSQIGNWDIFFYLIEKIFDITKLTVSKFTMLQAVFDLMVCLNESQKSSIDHIIKISEPFKDDPLFKDAIEVGKKLILESTNRFFLMQNGYLVLQGILNSASFSFAAEGNASGIGGMLKKYFDSVNAIDEAIGYRCLVNVLMNMSILSKLPVVEQVDILRHLSNVVSSSSYFNLKLQRSLKIKYLLTSVLRQYLPELYRMFLELRKKSEEHPHQLNQKNLQELQNEGSGLSANTPMSNLSRTHDEDYSNSLSDSSAPSMFRSGFNQLDGIEPKADAELKCQFDESQKVCREIFWLIYKIITRRHTNNEEVFQQQFQVILEFLSSAQKVGVKIQEQKKKEIDNAAFEQKQIETNVMVVSKEAFQIPDDPDFKIIKKAQLMPENRSRKVSKTTKQLSSSQASGSSSKIRKGSSTLDNSSSDNQADSPAAALADTASTLHGSQGSAVTASTDDKQAAGIIEEKFELDLYEYSFFIEELMYLIYKTITKKEISKTNPQADKPSSDRMQQSSAPQQQQQENSTNQFIFRRIITMIFMQNERMFFPKKSVTTPSSKGRTQSRPYGETTSVSASNDQDIKLNLQESRSIFAQSNKYKPKQMDFNDVAMDSQSISSSKESSNTNFMRNQMRIDPGNYEFSDKGTMVDYMWQSALLQCPNIDIILDVRIKSIVGKYQKRVQKFLIETIVNFIEQFQTSILDELIVKFSLYAKFLNQVLLRLAQNLEEKDCSEGLLPIFNDYSNLQNDSRKAKLPFFQTNSPLLIFASKMALFEQTSKKGVIDGIVGNINGILKRNQLQHSQFMYFLSSVLHSSPPHEYVDQKNKLLNSNPFIVNYLLFVVFNDPVPRSFFTIIMSILTLFLYPPEQLLTKPSLDQFLNSLYRMLEILQKEVKFDANNKYHIRAVNNATQLSFVFEYIAIYARENTLDFCGKTGKSLHLLLDRLCVFWKEIKFQLNSDQALQVFFNTDPNSLAESLENKIMGSTSVDSLNCGSLRAVLNGSFILLNGLQSFKNQESQELSLNVLDLLLPIENIYEMQKSTNLRSSVVQLVADPDILQSAQLTEIDKQQQQQLSQGLSRKTEQLMQTSIYILAKLLDLFRNQVSSSSTTQSSDSKSILMNFVLKSNKNSNQPEQKVARRTLEMIAIFFAKAFKCGAFRRVQCYINYLKSTTRNSISKDLDEQVQYQKKEDDNKLRDILAITEQDQFQRSLRVYLDQIVQNNFIMQKRVLSADSISIDISSSSSQSVKEDMGYIIQLAGQESEAWCIRNKEESLENLLDHISSLVLTSENSAFLNFLSIPFASINDFISSVAPLFYQRLLLKEKMTIEDDNQQIEMSLLPVELDRFSNSGDIPKHLIQHEQQDLNFAKIFERKWNKIKTILESEKGIFFRMRSDEILLQTQSQKFDSLGRRVFVFFTPQEKSKFKNHQKYQLDYLEESRKYNSVYESKSNQLVTQLQESDTYGKLTITAVEELNEYLQDDNAEGDKHEKEQEVEDIFDCGVQLKKENKKYEAELISQRQSLYGMLTILEYSDGDSEIHFESKKCLVRGDQKVDQEEESVMGQEQFNKIKKYLLGSLEPAKQDWKKVVKLKQVTEIVCQTYNSLENAIEIFISSNKSYFFTFYSGADRSSFLRLVEKCKVASSLALKVLRTEQIRKRVSKATLRWQEDDISNFEYLMLLNKYSGRSFNDINQYYVFPWVIKDFTSDKLDLNNKVKTYRDLTKHIGAQNPERYKWFQAKYEDSEAAGAENYGLYGSHFSTAVHVIYYLIRMDPFTSLNVQLQSGKFDHPDRLFFNMASTWDSCYTATSDLKELVPEFYFLPDFLSNKSKIDFGMRQRRQDHLGEDSGLKVENVELPKWALGSPHLFIQLQRAALESKIVSENLNDWIDLMFGISRNQKTNSFNEKTYKSIISKKILDIHSRMQEKDIGYLKSIVAQTQCFGTFPTQIFFEKHPKKNVGEVADPIDNFDIHKESGATVDKDEKRKKKYQSRPEIEEKDNPIVFFKIVETKFGSTTQSDAPNSKHKQIEQITRTNIFFVRRDSSDPNTLIVNSSLMLWNNEARSKITNSVKLVNKIHKLTNKDEAAAEASIEKLFAFFDCDTFFLVNQRLNTIEVYVNLEFKTSISLTSQSFSAIECLKHPSSGTLVATCGSKLFLADFNTQSLKKNAKNSKEKLAQMSNSEFQNAKMVYGHYSQIILIDVCSEIDTIVSIDQENTILVHTSDGKCMRKLSIEPVYRDFTKMRVSSDGYIALICSQNNSSPKEKRKANTLLLQHINEMTTCSNVLDDAKDYYTDVQFIDYKSMVVSKRNNIEFWDFFMYHFLKEGQSQAKKKIIIDRDDLEKKYISTNKSIGVYYKRYTLLVYLLKTRTKQDKTKRVDQFISISTSKNNYQDIIEKLDWV